MPNDWIQIVRVDRLSAQDATDEKEGYHCFVLFLGSVDAAGDSREMSARIVAKTVHLEDPQNPGKRIRR